MLSALGEMDKRTLYVKLNFESNNLQSCTKVFLVFESKAQNSSLHMVGVQCAMSIPVSLI